MSAHTPSENNNNNDTKVDRTCEKCGKEFRRPSALKEHLSKKTPCVKPSEEHTPSDTAVAVHKCDLCGKTYGSEAILLRHTRQNCTIAKEMVAEAATATATAATVEVPTVQKMLQEVADQVAVQMTDIQKRTRELQIITDDFIETMARMRVLVTAATGNAAVAVVPDDEILNWNEGKLILSIDELNQFVAENASFRQFMLGSTELKTSFETGPKLAATIVVDLVKFIHKNPRARNIYLIPNRHDHATIYNDGVWIEAPLTDCINLLFRSAINTMCAVGDKQRPPEQALESGARSAMGIVQLTSRAKIEPTDKLKLVDLAKPAFIAHLMNNAPRHAKHQHQ